MLQLTPDSSYNRSLPGGKHNPTAPYRFGQDYTAVIFDLFDTLVILGDEHTSYIESLRKTHQYLSSNGLDCSFSAFKAAYFKMVEKISQETAFSLEEPHFSTYIEGTITELGQNLKDKTFLAIEAVNAFSEEFKKYITLDPQAFEVLKNVHKDRKVGLISNLTVSECAWELLEEYGLKQFFDVIVVSGDVNLRKPHPQIFNMALRFLEVEPSQAVFVGDTPETDVLGSMKAGMCSVQIKRRSANAADIKPHYTITELNQLLPLLGISKKVEAPEVAVMESGVHEVIASF
jgi:haloacid dehalogenase superfamily, subfamily IA, variant 3 with third motif having DD or ED/haloacid dehalogenase superfamily, subfamily IA, variant 1 with third motif having Dx(3-4)D or Dx(3-4)E